MPQDDFNIVHMNEGAMFVQHFNEPAHVGPLEMMRQIDSQRDRGNRVLRRVRLVPDLDWEPEVRHANTVNGNLSVIGEALRIYEIWQMMHFCNVPGLQLSARRDSVMKRVAQNVILQFSIP